MQIKEHCFRSGPGFGIGSSIIVVLAKDPRWVLAHHVGGVPEERLEEVRRERGLQRPCPPPVQED